MKHCRQIVFFICIGFIQSLAQNYTQSIRGKVRDADNKQELIGVAITLLDNNNIASVTDENGNFKLINVPIGRCAIKATAIGYNEVTINNLDLTSAKEIVLNIDLIEKIYQSKVVEINAKKDQFRANNEMATLSSRSFNSDETSRYAGSRGDPSKMATNFAGVSSGNDARNDIIVRGNSPIGVLWRLEGIDIPSPNHFSAQGATGGPISILNNNLLSNSDFFTGAWPAEYGNKNAAVFDLKLRNGNNEKQEFVGQIGINGFELGVEGPFKKKYAGSYLINYRYSTLSVFSTLGINFGVSGVPQYQDVSWKINLPTKKMGVFNIWGIGGISNVSLLDSKKKGDDWSFTSAGTDLVYGSKMGAMGVSNTHYYTKKIFGSVHLSVTAAQFLATVDTLSSAKEKYRTYNSDALDEQNHLIYKLNYKINAKHLLKASVGLNYMTFNYKIGVYSRLYKSYIDLLNEKSGTLLLQSFVAWQWRINDRTVLNTGLHYQQLMLNNTKAIEPRIGIRFQVAQNQYISAAYGLHNQMQPLVNYFYKTYIESSQSYVKTNINMGFTTSNQFVLGYEIMPAEKIKIKLETYYQQQTNVPIDGAQKNYYSMLNQGSDIGGLDLQDSLVNAGRGKNYGAELTIEKIFSNNFYYLMSASLFESKYQGSDGVWHHTAFSGGYVANVLAGYEYPINNGKFKISLDIKTTFAGGNRYVPINEQASVKAGEAVYIASDAFEKKFNDFRKTDVKLSCKFNRKKTSHSLFVSLENIFNHKNVLRQYYDPRLGKLKIEYQFGLFPIGGYRIEF